MISAFNKPYSIEKPLISIITVVFNNSKFVRGALESVLSGNHVEIEYIVIDGGSTDGTINIVQEYKHKISKFISEPDNGIYDAMNKGVKVSNGEYIAFINSDDYYKSGVLNNVISSILIDKPDLLYGNLDYINNNGDIKRHWVAGGYHKVRTRSLWIPPHPTIFMKKTIFEEVGGFNLNYSLASDYDLILKSLLASNKVNYLNEVIVKMRLGGVTNISWINILKQNLEIINSYKICYGKYPIYGFFSKITDRLIQVIRAKFINKTE